MSVAERPPSIPTERALDLALFVAIALVLLALGLTARRSQVGAPVEAAAPAASESEQPGR